MAGSDQEYVPGVCNIGTAEAKKRRVLGWIGLVLTIVLWAAFVLLKAVAAWRLLLFVPALLAALGFLQSRWQFCAKYGLRGAYKFGRNVGKPDNQDGIECRRKDRRTALRIIGFAALIGLAAAVAAYLLPL